MAEMTSLQRVQAVLDGRMPDRLPVIPQGFMFSAKSAGYSIGEINRSPAKMAQSHLACLEKYGYDGCVVDVDDATLAEACGAKVIFRDRDVASVDEHNPVLTDLRDIDDLQLPDPLRDGRICDWLETTPASGGSGRRPGVHHGPGRPGPLQPAVPPAGDPGPDDGPSHRGRGRHPPRAGVDHPGPHPLRPGPAPGRRPRHQHGWTPTPAPT